MKTLTKYYRILFKPGYVENNMVFFLQDGDSLNLTWPLRKETQVFHFHEKMDFEEHKRILGLLGADLTVEYG